MDKKTVVNAEFAGVLIPTQSRVAYYSQNECLKKAFKALGICWLTAGVTVFIPIIHLVITPLALLAGPIAGLFVFIKVQKLPRLVEGSVICNHCSTLTHFHFLNANPRYYEVCEHCRTGYEILWPPQEV